MKRPLILSLMLAVLLGSSAAEAERRPIERYRKLSPRTVVLRLVLQDSEPIEITGREWRRMLRAAEPTRQLAERISGGRPIAADLTWEEHVLSEHAGLVFMRRFHGYQEEPLMEKAWKAHAGLAEDGDWRAAVERMGRHYMDLTAVGQLGWVVLSDIPLPASRAVFEAEVGEILEPIVTTWGVSVFGVMDIRPSSEGKAEQRLVRQLLFQWESFEVERYNVYAARGVVRVKLRARPAHESIEHLFPRFARTGR